MIKNHAHFKRLLSAQGTQLETLALANEISGGRLQVGQIRKVTKADTTGVYLQLEGVEGRGSFLGFDKASDWTFDGDVATASWGGSYRVILNAQVAA
jgi:hypothetical protein